MAQILSAFGAALLFATATIFAAPAPLAVEWRVTKVDRAAQGNRRTNLKFGPDGMLHLVFTGCSDKECKSSELFHAHRNISDTRWAVESVDREDDDTGWFPSLEITSDGTLHAFYANHKKETFQHAEKRLNGSWETRALGKGHGGWWTATTMGPGDQIYAAHTKILSDDMRQTALEVGTLTKGVWAAQSVDTSPSAGWFTAMATGLDGMPLVTYMQGSYPAGNFKLAQKTAQGWKIRDIDTQGVKSDIAVDRNGAIHIIYQKIDPVFGDNQTDLMYATNAATGDEFRLQLLDGGMPPHKDTGFHPRLAIDGYGGLHAVYRHPLSSSLIYARNLTGVWEFSPVGEKVGGLYASIVVDGKGGVHLAYDAGTEIFSAYCANCAIH